VIAAAGHGWGLAIFPLMAAAIALVFAAVLAQRVADRWRPHEAVWVLALLMYAVASGAMFLGVRGGWTPSAFRVYWLFGAVLNVPFLLAGEVYLLAPRRAMAHAFLVVLGVLSVRAAVAVLTATVHPAPLAGTLPLGKDVFDDGSLPYRLAQYYSLPAYFLLLGGLVWSALKMKGKPDLKDRTVGTFLIAAGATVVAIGSGIGAAYHVVPLFSVSLAVGIAVMFWGFLRVSRPSAHPPAPAR
jgi:hypothetical protein